MWLSVRFLYCCPWDGYSMTSFQASVGLERIYDGWDSLNSFFCRVEPYFALNFLVCWFVCLVWHLPFSVDFSEQANWLNLVCIPSHFLRDFTIWYCLSAYTVAVKGGEVDTVLAGSSFVILCPMCSTWLCASSGGAVMVLVTNAYCWINGELKIKGLPHSKVYKDAYSKCTCMYACQLRVPCTSKDSKRHPSLFLLMRAHQQA